MTSEFNSIEDLRSALGGKKQVLTPEYSEKMMHPFPKSEVVDRMKFILEHCKGKRVMEFGASGNLHDKLLEVSTEVIGYDLVAGDNVVVFDLDDVSQPDLPHVASLPEIIVCGEILEHLSNPGWFLTRLHRQYPGIPVIVSVPNAFSDTLQVWVKKGIENVNKQHVAWYSPKTLSVLLERSGFGVGGLYFYNGTGPTAEGLIVFNE